MQTELMEDRLRVLRELGVNMVVEAGAGTGKTTLLITRICLAVVAQDIAIDKIVALTFTEKAAAEIKTRLMAALHMLVQGIHNQSSGQPTPEQSLLGFIQQNFHLTNDIILPRVQAALARLDRASIGTIHSFCADILKTFPLEAGLSPQAEIDPGQKSARLFQLRWNAFLDVELGERAPRKELWQAVLSEISLTELKSFTQELCSGKIEHYDYFSHAAMVGALCEEKAALACQWSTAFLDPKKPTARRIEKALSWAHDSLLRSAAFLRKASVPPPLPDPPTLGSDCPKGWDEETYEDARGLVQFALKLQPEKQHIFEQAFELVKAVVLQIRADYAQAGILSFDDLIVKTRNLVQTDLYVRRVLKEKLEILFIDEFQDTDPVQGELLLFLAEEKTACAKRWQDVTLQAGKLVVVGDPKQSIYRFRGADITAYELFTQLILSQGGVKCFLRQNYRSVADIVALANAVCSRAMVQQSSFQPAYEPIYPIKPARPQSVRWLFVRASSTGSVLADDFRANQAQCIARWIAENVGKMTLANGEKLAYHDIAILSRAATTLGPYTDALRRLAIPFTAQGEKNFFKRQEINDLLNFLRVCVDPADTTSLVGVLRGPLGGLSDEEICQIAERGELSIYAKTQDEILARLYALISDFVNQVDRMDVTQFLERVLEQTFLLPGCAAAYEGEQTLEILMHLVGQVQTILGEKPASLGQFLAGIEQILNTTPELLNTPASDAANAVSVMTVHKSKGLDFPVVILADLSKKETAAPGVQNQHLFSWQYNMHGLRAGKICDANLAFLEEEQKKHERCEEVRILYVALTRAKEQLVLVADGRKAPGKTARAFSDVGLWPDGTTAVLSGADAVAEVSYVNYEPAEHFIFSQKPACTPDVPSQEPAHWRSAFAARQVRYEALRARQDLAPSQQVEGHQALAPIQQAAATVGNLCHRVLRLLLMNEAAPLDELVSRVCYTPLESVYQLEALSLLRPFTQSRLWAELKNTNVLASEMPFSFCTSQGDVCSGVMDAVLELADGSIWVVDYKTDQIPAQGPAVLLEKYRPQLTVYAQAARKIFKDKPVRCSVVLVRTFAALDL